MVKIDWDAATDNIKIDRYEIIYFSHIAGAQIGRDILPGNVLSRDVIKSLFDGNEDLTIDVYAYDALNNYDKISVNYDVYLEQYTF
jgi:hypothetical protein